MRIAYLIMTHENPLLLQRMIRTLSFGDEECAFFIHLDRKTAFEGFSSVCGQNVWFSNNRIPVYWGEFSQVDAILSLVRKAIESPSGYDYCVLITGSCYPLRTGGYIRRFLEANQGLEYMDILMVPAPGKPLSRLNTIRYPSTKPIRRFVFRALARIGLAQRDHRKYLGGLEPYSGDGAWALTREACQYVIDFMAANPHLERYYRKTFAADEAFLQTILGNSKFRERMQRNFVYVDWSCRMNGHPEMLCDEHVRLFEKRDRVDRERLAEMFVQASSPHLEEMPRDEINRLQQQERFLRLAPMSQQLGISHSDTYRLGELLFARKFNDARLDVVSRIDAMIERKESVRLPQVSSERSNPDFQVACSYTSSSM